MQRDNERVDVVIVGSGPNGAAIARKLSEERPGLRVLLVEAGPQLTAVPGLHMKNVADEHERLIAQLRSQGPEYEDTVADLASREAGFAARPGEVVARLGTSFVDPSRAFETVTDTLPAAALSTNVGGMAAHWTCACPHPYGRERIPFISDPEWDDLVSEGRRLLAVTTEAFPRTRQGEAILRTLSLELDDELPEGRKVQRMPLACRIDAGGVRHWAGSDVVLGPLVTDPPDAFTLRAETLCRRVIHEDGRAAGVVLADRKTGEEYRVHARAVALACDSFRTPQLLWASGIRPRALGHFLNDHIQIFAGVTLDDELVARMTADLSDRDFPDARGHEADPMVGVFWVPYADDAHPFHSQVMHWDMSPQKLTGDDAGQVVGIGALFSKVDIRYEDCVTFSDTEVDAFGMPRMSISYALTENDRAQIESIRRQQDRAAAAFGSYAQGREPRIMPPGSSLHYQGTFRMAESEDGESVCDPYGRVWGFDNLYLAGNGVIPTMTCGNSTLTSVSIAVRSARALAADL